MKGFPLTLACLALSAGVALGVGACGGDGEEKRQVDPEALLDTAFSHPITSSVTAADLRIDVRGVPALAGPVTLSVDGPYVSGGGTSIPSFDWDWEAKVAGFGLDGQLVSTGDNIYLSVFGDNYQVGREAVEAQNQRLRDLGDLGIEPRRWLGKASYEGDEEVAGTDTAHLSANLRGDQVSADLRALSDRLGRDPGAAPLIRGGRIEVWVGIDDEIIRQLKLDAGFTVPPEQRDRAGGASGGDLALEVVQTDAGEAQEITIPEGGGFKPIGDLLSSLRELGLSGLGV